MIAGNFEDKYNTKNPISRVLMNGFLRSFDELLDMVESPSKIAEVGAGEGQLMKILLKKFPDSSFLASDISKKMAGIARKNLKESAVSIGVENVEALSYKSGEVGLVVCCEVLEHVDHPAQAIKEVRRVTQKWVLVSVPIEPLWRILNLARLKYVKDLGNTPGHINHWSPEAFTSLVKRLGFKIVDSRYPLPWQMYLLKKI